MRGEARRGEDGYNESLHSLVGNVQAGANGRAERDVAAEMLRDVARPDRRITNMWARRKGGFLNCTPKVGHPSNLWGVLHD